MSHVKYLSEIPYPVTSVYERANLPGTNLTSLKRFYICNNTATKCEIIATQDCSRHFVTKEEDGSCRHFCEIIPIIAEQPERNNYRRGSVNTNLIPIGNRVKELDVRDYNCPNWMCPFVCNYRVKEFKGLLKRMEEGPHDPKTYEKIKRIIETRSFEITQSDENDAGH